MTGFQYIFLACISAIAFYMLGEILGDIAMNINKKNKKQNANQM